MIKTKMDKVRRLLGNRYGEEARDAVLALLGHIVEQGAEVFDSAEDNGMIPQGTAEMAIKAIEDLVTRAKKEPREIEVADEEVKEEE